MSATEGSRAIAASGTTEAGGEARGQGGATIVKSRSHLRAYLMGVVTIPLAAFIVGFFLFAAKVRHAEPSLSGHADGVVALTGGSERIADAVEILAQGHAGRLLITGVNQSTKSASIARLTPQYRHLFDCCIDLGYEAANTLGNATETRRWAAFHGIRSLIVVTSNYHMPRALIEMGHELPGVQLIAYPVVSDRQKSGRWWPDFSMAKLMASEYVKYLEAIARTSVGPPAPWRERTGTASAEPGKI